MSAGMTCIRWRWLWLMYIVGALEKWSRYWSALNLHFIWRPPDGDGCDYKETSCRSLWRMQLPVLSLWAQSLILGVFCKSVVWNCTHWLTTCDWLVISQFHSQTRPSSSHQFPLQSCGGNAHLEASKTRLQKPVDVWIAVSIFYTV